MIENLEFFAALAAFVGFFSWILWLGKRRDERQAAAKAPRASAARAPAKADTGYREAAPHTVPATPPNVAGLRLRIVDFDDGPQELEGQLPFVCTHVRRLPGRDRPDYDLFEVQTPILWQGRRVDRVVIAPRMVGARLGRGMRKLPVALALAKDGRLAEATELDFDEAQYVAVAFATSIDA